MPESFSRPLNLLLAALPQAEYLRLAPYITTVHLPLGKVIYEALDEIETVYFPHRAIISLVSFLENGATTEVGIVGSNGMVDFSVILGGNYSHNRAIVQLPGSASLISAKVVKREFSRGGKFQELILRGVEHRLSNASQLAVCNRHHTIEQRLARWLLQVRSLVQTNELSLTQEFLAKMLGVRRAGVTVAAQNLQRAGAIDYSRGNIMILNPQILERNSCECYGMLRADFHRLFDSELN